MRVHISIIFLLLVVTGFTQVDSDIQLAEHYYAQGEFEKARGYYEALYKTNPSKIYLNRLVNCFEAEGDEKQAEKILKKAAARAPSDLDLKLLLSNFYEEHNADLKAKRIYEALLANYITSASRGISLFNAFLSQSKIDFAQRSLDISKKQFKNYPFNFQEADLYAQTNKNPEMVDSYLSLLDKHQYYDKAVKKALLRRLDLSSELTSDFKLLKQALFLRAQKVNTDVVFAELLIWM